MAATNGAKVAAGNGDASKATTTPVKKPAAKAETSPKKADKPPTKNGSSTAEKSKAATKSPSKNGDKSASPPDEDAATATTHYLANQNASLISSETWDVYTPPPINTIKGKIIPRAVNKHQKRRKICLEIYKISPPVAKVSDGKGGQKVVPSYEECVIRVLTPATKDKKKEVLKEASQLRKSGAKGTTTPTTAVSSAATTVSTSPEADEETVVPAEIIDPGLAKDPDGWKALYRIPVRAFTIKNTVKKSVFVFVEIGKSKQERELIFDSLEESQNFCKELEKEQMAEEKRADLRLEAALGDIKLPAFESITILVEIVSGWDLPIGDFSTSDPYVIVTMGPREIHRTKPIMGTLDPVWTLSTGSLFLMTVESKQLFMNEGFVCLVKDYDRVGKNELLGVVKIPAHDIYNGKGERTEYKLAPDPSSKLAEVPGYLYVRVRRATEYDKKFMEGYNESQVEAVAASDHPESTNSDLRSLVTKLERVDKGVKQFKVRPTPDPKRPETTEWMTKEEIQAECMKESKHWVYAGSGNLGRIFLEVIGCDDLPNLDAGGFLGNKTDAFVSLVYEDCCVRTDTIDDCLAPRWLPWSRRAFVFSIAHPSSQVMLGVFDYDAGFDDHDLIGRVSVDVSNFQPDTLYELKYTIYPSARISGREASGQVTIRLRLEIEDPRKMLLAALEPPAPVYVNVKKRKDFRVIRATCLGKYDSDQYSIKTIKSYVEELRSYQHILLIIEDAVIALLLWRGHLPMKIGSATIKLPIHSINAFVVAVVLVERPQLIPSFGFASIAWLLLAIMGYRRNSANLWTHCRSFKEFAQALALGVSKAPPKKIEPYENYEEAKLETEEWLKRIAEAEKKAEQKFLESQQAEMERLKELEEIGETDHDISTKVGSEFTIDPIKAALHPVQLLLGVICRQIRFVGNIFIWEENYFSFWLTAGSLILAVGSMFVPWFWILKWVSRIVVWTFFGPWMKLVDLYYVSTLEPETEEQLKRREQKEKLARKLATTQAAKENRMKREEAIKLKEMKKYMFGKFAMKVPILKQDRYRDIPLPESSATPYKQKPLSLAELAMQEAGYNRTRLPGQNLVGTMIPTVESLTFTSAPIGKATAQPRLLDENAPGSERDQKSDSTAMAYVKIGAVIVAAGVITWFGVPFLASTLGQLGEANPQLQESMNGKLQSAFDVLQGMKDGGNKVVQQVAAKVGYEL